MHPHHTPNASTPPLAADAEPYGYVRVSTVMQRLKGYSIPKQLRQIADAARADGGPIPAANLLGDADSGRKFERASLQRLLASARAGQVSVVYFTKVDRIGRNARDSLNIVHDLRSCGVRLVVLEPRLDTNDPFGYFLFVILAAMAELEATYILERTMSGKLEQMVQAHKAGRAPKPQSRKAPYGLRYVPVGQDGEGERYDRYPEQARWVLYAHTEVARGQSSDAVAEDLNQRGIPAPEGGRWYANAIRRIIHSECYSGHIVRRYGQQTFTFPCEEIVPPALRERALAQLTRNKAQARRNTKYEYLLQGTRDDPLLVCRRCAREGRTHMMGGRTNHARAAQGKAAQSYVCHHDENGRQATHTVGASPLEEAIWGAIVEMAQDPDEVLGRFQKLADAASSETRAIDAEIATLEERAAQNRLAQKRLLERAVRGRLSEDLVREQEDELEREAHDLAARKSMLAVQLEQARTGQAPIAQVRDALRLIADGLLEAGFEDKKWIIRQMCRRIWADTEGWELEGILPGLVREGTFEKRSIVARASSSLFHNLTRTNLTFRLSGQFAQPRTAA